jgi:hypothetical protein
LHPSLPGAIPSNLRMSMELFAHFLVRVAV